MRILILILVLLVSCKNNTQVNIDLRTLYSKAINIPQNLEIYFNSKDSIIDDIYKSKLKYIVYADSMECTSCRINKMYMWELFIKYAEHFNGNQKFYFIFRGVKSSLNDFYMSLVANPINYPIFIDKNGNFEKLNPHLPKNNSFHAFLLDENNKVILVGNPPHNKDIEKLFYKKT